MARVLWPLNGGRPGVEVVLVPHTGGPPLTRTLLADTGAGTMASRFDLLLALADCQSCAGVPSHTVVLGRAYRGRHSVYAIRVEIPALGFRQVIRAAGVTSPPSGFDGIACFPFINRFTYGNFGDTTRFGLEC